MGLRPAGALSADARRESTRLAGMGDADRTAVVALLRVAARPTSQREGSAARPGQGGRGTGLVYAATASGARQHQQRLQFDFDAAAWRVQAARAGVVFGPAANGRGAADRSIWHQEH